MPSNQKQNRNQMICGTRAMKNAEHIKKIAPHLISKEKGKGITSLVPMETLHKLHTIDNPHDHIQNKELADLISKNTILKPRDVVSGPLFNGTLRFVNINFTNTGNVDISMSGADIQTIIDYSNHAIIPISQYSSQYGPNSLNVSSDIITFDADLGGISTYNESMLRGWIDSIASSNSLGSDSCIMIFNPASLGIVNTDEDPNLGIGGFHGIQNGVPFCFNNVSGQNLTVDDNQNVYAQILSHEIAEMTVDPGFNGGNPEVCDACAGNCDNLWLIYFDNNDQFIDGLGPNSIQPTPPAGSAYFINAIVGTNFQLKGDESCLADRSGNHLHDACVYNPSNLPSGQSKKR